MAHFPNALTMLHGDGLFTLTTHHFIKPPDIGTVDRRKNAKATPIYDNVLFPGQTTLPTTDLPLHFMDNNGAFEAVRSDQFKDDRGVTETRFTLRLVRHRIDPNAGFAMSFVRAYHESTDDFAAAGLTCQLSISASGVDKTARPQTIDFPAIADAPATTQKIELNAKSSAGLSVDYFVWKGPGIIKDGAFIPAEFPAGASKPIEVTIGAYQVGLFDENQGVKPSQTVFQTFHLMP